VEPSPFIISGQREKAPLLNHKRILLLDSVWELHTPFGAREANVDLVLF